MTSKFIAKVLKGHILRAQGKKINEAFCDASNPEGLLITRQPVEDLCMSGNLTPHH